VGNYDFTVRFTYNTQTADIPVRLVIYIMSSEGLSI